MIKKRWFFLLFMFVAGSIIPAAAQWRVGVQAGYTHNSLATESGYFYDRRYVGLGGFSAGIPVQYEFFDWLAVQAELSYVQKNYGMRRSGYYKELHEDMTNHYLSVPLFARFSFGTERIRGFLDAGVYAGGWLAARRKGVTFSQFSEKLEESHQGIGNEVGLYAYDEKYPFDSRRDNRFEGGALLGVGLEYKLSPVVALQAECRYNHSLSDMQKDYMIDRVPRYHNTFLFQVGVLVTLGKNKTALKQDIK